MKKIVSFKNLIEKMNIKVLVSTGIFIMLLSIAAAYISFLNDYNEHKEKILNMAKRMELLFEHEFSIRSHTVKALQLLAERNLDESVDLSTEIINYLKYVKEKKGFTLDIPPEYTEKEIGNLTGFGKIPMAESFIAKEMEMSLSLSPVFQTVIERDPETPWIYYTSMNDFIYLFPRVDVNEFFFTKRLHELDFVKRAMPQYNPERKVFWTPVYLDEAGKGYMVTVSAPVYNEDKFCGAVSLDISISRLKWLLQRYDVEYSSFYLMYSGGKQLVGLDDKAPEIIPEKWEKEKLVKKGKYWIVVHNLHVENWFVIIKTQRYKILLDSVKRSVPFIFVIILMCFGFYLIVNLNSALGRVQELSTKDSLTGVWNRRMFDTIIRDELNRINRQETKIGLIMFDVDNFKKYNDMYGHHEGDRVLIEISSCVKEVLKRVTDKIFRVGGEEFVIFTLIEKKAQLKQIMERIRKKVEALDIKHEKSQFGCVTISLGAALIDGKNKLEFEEVYKLTDDALYNAKDQGKNISCVV